MALAAGWQFLTLLFVGFGGLKGLAGLLVDRGMMPYAK